METISTSRKERKRLEAFSRGKSRDLTLAAASGLLGLSYRQPKQASARYRARGTLDWCIARGRASNRQSQDQIKQRALELYRQ